MNKQEQIEEMKRLIDANSLAERIQCSPLFNNFGEDGLFIRKFILHCIEEAKTADVVPRTEVAREILSEIEKFAKTCPSKLYTLRGLKDFIERIKKKYEVEKDGKAN